MSAEVGRIGHAELRAARKESRSLYWAAGLFSVFINLLVLTGPLFMLQVYDRVLNSRSEETLLSLTLLMAAMFFALGLLEFARGAVFSRIGARLSRRLEERVFSAGLAQAVTPNARAGPGDGIADLDAVQLVLGSRVFGALYDAPWTPIFLAGIALFHPWLGVFALAGGAILFAVTLLNRILTQSPLAEAGRATARADRLAERLVAGADTVQGVGMQAGAFARWRQIRDTARGAALAGADLSGAFASASRAFRMLLQSAILALGAYLVLLGQLSPGAMIATSILLGRALAPIDLVVGQWPAIQRARQGWRGLSELLGAVPQAPCRTTLPVPKAMLRVESLSVLHPGHETPALRRISFAVGPGEALGVIGPSGSGKSSLARAIAGTRSPAAGAIRLDGATLAQYGPEALAAHIGYLPQRVQLFEGSIAENIARLSPDPDAGRVIAAAKAAAAHALVTGLPDGYDTQVAWGEGRLSGGQVQRIGLARALYGDPVLLVLDEPNASLDQEGGEALNRAVRAHKAKGGAVLIMAHRPAAIQECETLLVLEAGDLRALGPRDEVLRKVVQNHARVVPQARTAGDRA